MRKLLVFFSMVVVAGMMSVNLTSCGSDDPMPVPTVKLLAEVDADDQYTVNLTVEATDATSYSWTYGDGETSTQMGSHQYLYGESGPYTISVIVTNESGTASATKSVTINASIQEMLAGVDPAGKQWVVSTTASASDGVGPLAESELVVNLPIALVGGDLLGYVGFSDEYDNVFTFKPDGSYAVDDVNGLNLCTAIKAMYTTGEMEPGNSWSMGKFGFATMAYSVGDDAAWAVTENSTVSFAAMSEDPTSSEAEPTLTPMDVSLENVTELVVSGSGYFGLLDMTNYVTFESVSADLMVVNVIIHTRDPEKPSMFARMTMVPVQ